MIAEALTVVAIASRAFAPAHATVLVGEQVTWNNQDHLVHTVSADEFDSGRLGAEATFSRRFDAVGRFEYVCRLHRGMKGSVTVTSVALAAPAPAAYGSTVALAGRAPAGTPEVVLERLASTGVEVVGGAAPSEDGSFSFSVPAVSPTRYRARVGFSSSAPVWVRVVPEVRIAARRGAVRVHVVPPAPGGTVELQRHERERFSFVPLAREKLDRHSRARFAVRGSRRHRLRVQALPRRGGFAAALSPVVIIPRRGAVHHGGHGQSHPGGYGSR